MNKRKTLEIYTSYDEPYSGDDLNELSSELSSETGTTITITEKCDPDSRTLIFIVGKTE